MTGTVELIRRSLAEGTRETFDRRVEEGAEYLRRLVDAGELESRDPTIGLELEAYVVDGRGRLATLPDDGLDDTPVNRELGKHNLEINTPPAVLDEAGVRGQFGTVRDHLAAAREALAGTDRSVVLDAMWTIPPEAGTMAYLSAAESREGFVLAENMYASPRYLAMDNDILRRAGGTVELDLPGVAAGFPSILVESLATSVQPHLQVPAVAEFPRFYNAAIRTLGPVLALTTNSPFLPADLYDGDAASVLDSTYHELRVPVFEQSINAGSDRGKVRFPRDIDRPADVIDRVVADGTVVPFLREWVDDGGADAAGFGEQFWEFGHKHGTYWRWLRGVIGGDVVDEHNDERSLRIEYRPVPTQPSVTDLVGVQCLVVGLLRGLVAADHPLVTLPWADAKAGFYAAVEDGLDAELHWVTEAGEPTTDPAVIYEEVFALARAGLADAGVAEATRERFLGPIERRWADRRVPSDWKLDRVRAAVAGGAGLAEAIESMQRAYIERAATGEPFADWPA